MSDQAKLREAIRWAETVDHPAIAYSHLATLREAARSTLPKTKMVEVWHVERAAMGVHLFISVCASRSGADSQAYTYSQDQDQKCVRVTGPHQHEVPA